MTIYYHQVASTDLVHYEGMEVIWGAAIVGANSLMVTVILAIGPDVEDYDETIIVDS